MEQLLKDLVVVSLLYSFMNITTEGGRSALPVFSVPGAFGLSCVILFVVVHGMRSYSWGLALDIGGSLLTLLAAVVVLWSLRRSKLTTSLATHKVTVGRSVSLVAIKDTQVHVPSLSPPATSSPSSASPALMEDPGVQAFPEDSLQASFLPVASGPDPSTTGPIARANDTQVRRDNPGKDVTSLLRSEPYRTSTLQNAQQTSV